MILFLVLQRLTYQYYQKESEYRYWNALNNIPEIHWNCEDSQIKRTCIWFCICKHYFELCILQWRQGDVVNDRLVSLVVFLWGFFLRQDFNIYIIMPFYHLTVIFIDLQTQFCKCNWLSKAGETVQTGFRAEFEDIFLSHLFSLCTYICLSWNTELFYQISKCCQVLNLSRSIKGLMQPLPWRIKTTWKWQLSLK